MIPKKQEKMHVRVSGRTKLSILITLAFSMLILPINEHIMFNVPEGNRGWLLAYASKALFALALFFMCHFLVGFIQRLRQRDGFYRDWLRFSVFYFVLMVFLLALVYPGHWLGDELRVLDAARNYELFTWQNLITNIYYTFCLYLIPSAVGIVVLQVVSISLMVGYIIAKTKAYLHRKRLVYLLYLPFILLPVLIYNVYPERATLYSYIELLLVYKILEVTYFRRPRLHLSALETIGMTLMIVLVAFWRSEGVYYLLLIPPLLFFFARSSNIHVHKVNRWLVLATCLLLVVMGVIDYKISTSPKYEVTVYISPISTMLQSPLKGDRIDSRIEQMNQVINVDAVKRQPSYTEIPGFWAGGVKGDFTAHMSEFRSQFFYLILHNPSLFFDNRWKVFLSTNSFYAKASASTGPLDGEQYKSNADAIRFIRENPLGTPLDAELKRYAIQALLTLDSNGNYTAASRIFWNVIPTILALSAIAIMLLLKRRYALFFVAALILARVPLLFLTAPANYFFYYFPVYLSGTFLLVLYAVHYIDQRKYSANSSGVPKQ